MAKTALITGANRGIGAAVARLLEERGCIVIRGVRQPKHALPIEVQLDVTSDASIREAAQLLSEEFNQLDILVNNAGILLDDEVSLEELSRDMFRDTLETNLLGPFAVTQAFLPLLRRANDPRVIHVGSGAGQMSAMGTFAPAYSVSKAALNALTIQQANAYRDDGISVNAVCPGWVRTDMGGGAAPRSPDEGADTVVWLALDEFDGKTGLFWRDRKVQEW
jgi:NAD(P)-dependent dehydrogenase (short-subunit alcohol dehydrogenase family)